MSTFVKTENKTIREACLDYSLRTYCSREKAGLNHTNVTGTNRLKGLQKGKIKKKQFVSEEFQTCHRV